MQPNKADRLISAVLWIALVAFAASLSFQDIRTWDYWWHLRTGDLIAAEGAVPKYDPYTYTVLGNRWIDVHWLHQLGLHYLYAAGGHTAVVLSKFAWVLALVGTLATIGYRRFRPAVSVLALTLMLCIAGDRFMPRPELPTFLCLAAVLALLERFSQRGDRWVYAIVAVQLFWVNVHGLFALGIVVTAIYLGAEAIRPIVSPGEGLRVERLRRLAGVIGLSLGVSLINPNFIDGAIYPIAQLGMIGPEDQRGFFGVMVEELLPPFGMGETLPPLALFFFVAIAALSFGAMAFNWSRIHAADPLMWVSFLYLALSAKRNLALFAIVAAPVLVRNLNDILDARKQSRNRAESGAGGAARRWRFATAAAGVVTLGVLSVDVVEDRFFERLDSPRTSGFGVVDFLYPEGAADWIEANRPPGPIAHHMADGGYLNWRLREDYPVMLDGRLEVYGAEKFMELQIPGSDLFRKLDDQYHFGMVLVHYSMEPSADILWWLYLNSNWQLAQVDDIAALFVRVPDGEPALYKVLDVDAPELFPPFDAEPNALDRKRHITRSGFYTALKRYSKGLEIWEAGLERYPDIPGGQVTHASLLQRNGSSEAAEAILRRLLEELPDDPDIHVQIGDMRLISADLVGALAHYDAALRLDRQLPYALYQRGQVFERAGDVASATRSYMEVLTRAHSADRMALLARSRLAALSAGSGLQMPF